MPDANCPPPISNADISLHAAQPSDVEQLCQLERKAFATDQLSRRQLRALVRSSSASFTVARCGDALLGYALVLTRRDSRAARLYSLAVDPAETGRGVGTRLLAAAEAMAQARGADELRLEVRADNEAGIRLYETSGYRRIGRRADYYEDGMTAVRYARKIGATDAGEDGSSFGQAA
jgi:ribosomal-protein-alanine acetyltransferase